MSFLPQSIQDYMIYLQGNNRRYNHLWPHAVEFRYAFDISYDFSQTINDLSEVQECDAFTYRVGTEWKNKNYRYEIVYESKRDVIPKDSFDRVKETNNKILDNFGFYISKSKSKFTFDRQKNNKWMYFVIGFFLIQLIVRLFKN